MNPETQSILEDVEDLSYKFAIDFGVSIIFIGSFMKVFNFWQ